MNAQNLENKSSCASILNKAKSKYGVIFNYSSQVFEKIDCIDSLPPDFKKFRKLMNQTSGLDFNNFSDSLWIVSKNYLHKIKVYNSFNEPLPNAYIKSKNEYSNSYGNIFINSEELPVQLKISHFNHEDYLLSIKEKSPFEIKVQMQIKENQLDAVNLKSLYANSIFLNSENHIKVKVKKMPLLAGQTQQDAFVSLLNLPQISTNVESVAELNIKGGINDQNLVLWNGIRMFQNAHFFGLLSAYNENLIEEITVIDNATPAEYGNALTGTIMLDYDNNITDKNAYGVGINALSSQVFSRLALGKNTELSVAFQRSFTDVFNSPTFQSYTDKAFTDTDLQLSENSESSNSIRREDDFYYQDAQFQLKQRFSDKFRINVQGIYFENTLDYQESVENRDSRISNYNTENTAFGVDAEYDLNNRESLFFKTNYTSHSSIGQNNTFSGNLDTEQSNTVENYITQLSWQKQNIHTEWKAGIEFEGSVVFNRFNNAVSEAFLNLGQVSNLYSGFGSYTFNKENWYLYAGLRSVYFQRDEKLRIEPRLQINYRVTNNIDVVVRSEIKSQNFKQIIDLDQNFLGIEKRRWVVSGDSISPPLQRTSQVELMLKWNFNKVGGYASVFRRDLKGISTNDQRFQNEGQFQNIIEGDSEIYGAIFHLYYKISWLNSWLSYSHLNENLIFDNQEFRGNNSLNHHITWGNNIIHNNWTLSLALNYHSGLPFTPVDQILPLIESPNRNQINFEHANSGTLPDYFRLDSSIQYQFHTNKVGDFKISLGLINLTDKHNLLRKNFRLNRVNEQNIQQIDNVGLEFTANLGILWTL